MAHKYEDENSRVDLRILKAEAIFLFVESLAGRSGRYFDFTGEKS
jgi:hypothetical protein